MLTLLLADSRTPTGTYAHSLGLEVAVARGLTADEVPAFLRGRLHTVARTEAGLACAALRVGGDVAQLCRLDAEAWARTPGSPLRNASTALGQALLRTARQLVPASAVLSDYERASAMTPSPIVRGLVAGLAGCTAEETALASLYDDLATVATAAVKLLPVDAAVASGWVAALGTEVEMLVPGLAAGDLPSFAAPLIELRSLHHTNQEGRLFVT